MYYVHFCNVQLCISVLCDCPSVILQFCMVSLYVQLSNSVLAIMYHVPCNFVILCFTSLFLCSLQLWTSVHTVRISVLHNYVALCSKFVSLSFTTKDRKTMSLSTMLTHNWVRGILVPFSCCPCTLHLCIPAYTCTTRLCLFVPCNCLSM